MRQLLNVSSLSPICLCALLTTFTMTTQAQHHIHDHTICNELLNVAIPGMASPIRQKWSTRRAIPYTFDVRNWNKGIHGISHSPEKLNNHERAAVRKALATWEAIIPVRFVEYNPHHQNRKNGFGFVIRKVEFNNPSIYAYTQPYSIPTSKYGTRRQILNVDMIVNNFDHYVLVHEIGHALGLMHPTSFNDSQFSVMRTTDREDRQLVPMTPMPYDIVAAQRLYGKPPSNKQSTDFEFTGKSSLIKGKKRGHTLWHAGKRASLISHYEGDVILDLRQGTQHRSLIGNDIVFIAEDTHVDTAKAINSKRAIIVGNDEDNELHGGTGFNLFVSNEGSDTIYAGPSQNYYLFDSISDSNHENSDKIVNFNSSKDKIILTNSLGQVNLDDIRIFYDAGYTVIQHTENGFRLELKGDISLNASHFLIGGKGNEHLQKEKVKSKSAQDWI